MREGERNKSEKTFDVKEFLYAVSASQREQFLEHLGLIKDPIEAAKERLNLTQRDAEGNERTRE